MAKCIYSIITLIITSILLSVFSSKGEIVSFINYSFLFGLFFLMIGAAIYVAKGGFFSIFIKSFKKLNKLPGLTMDDEPVLMPKEKRDAFYNQAQIIFSSAGLILILTSAVTLYFS